MGERQKVSTSFCRSKKAVVIEVTVKYFSAATYEIFDTKCLFFGYLSSGKTFSEEETKTQQIDWLPFLNPPPLRLPRYC